MLPVSYGSMLIEGLLGMMAVVSVAWLSRDILADQMTQMNPVQAFAAGLGQFGESLGIGAEYGALFVSLAVSAFLLTTLDTATRLARFTWQEMAAPREGSEQAPGPVRRLFANPWVATGLSVAVAAQLCTSGGAGVIWPVFGASNQLLAALTLLVVVLYLMHRGVNALAAIIPMVIMLCVSVCGLVMLLIANLGIGEGELNTTLVVATAALLLLSTVLVFQSFRCLLRRR